MCNSFLVKFLKYFLITFFLSGLFIPVHSNIIQVKDSISYKHKTFDAEDLKRGERLFFGLVYLENKSINCAGCHNTRISDTLNWNPDAVEISKKYLDKSAADLGKVLLNPAGKKMTQVHK